MHKDWQRPDISAYNAAISACENGVQPGGALELSEARQFVRRHIPLRRNAGRLLLHAVVIACAAGEWTIPAFFCAPISANATLTISQTLAFSTLMSGSTSGRAARIGILSGRETVRSATAKD